jgi:hypothetical protein
MENKELIKQLESLADSCDSDYALFINGYNRGVLDAIILVNRHFVEQSSQPINSGWVLCDEDMPEPLETVWISNGKGWTTLGCIVDFEEGYCWAELVNGLVYQEGDKIVAECEADDMDVVFWHRLPQPPKQ